MTKDRTITRTVVVKAPDGTVTKEITKENNIVKDVKKERPLATGTSRSDWLVQGGMGANSVNRIYMLGVHRQVLGPVYLGVQVQRESVRGDSLLGVVTFSF